MTCVQVSSAPLKGVLVVAQAPGEQMQQQPRLCFLTSGCLSFFQNGLSSSPPRLRRAPAQTIVPGLQPSTVMGQHSSAACQ